MEIKSFPVTLKKLLTKAQNWYRFRQYNIDKGTPLRPIITTSISQVLSCKHYARGHAQYYCTNKSCSHEKKVAFTCKNRMCNSCGKVASDKWVEKQKHVLPKTDFQHITMTMPSELWPLFDLNRELLTKLPTIANNVILKLAKQKKAVPGIFTALHTFGRQLNWNCHVHLSVTRGGLTKDNQWKKLYFVAKNVMSMWRYEVIDLIRQHYKCGKLTLPKEIDVRLINQFLNKHYSRHWHIHCAKPQKSAEKDIAYLGRYIKRPPLSNARLLHYSGQDVAFEYHDHKTNTDKELHLSVFEFLDIFTKHIPEKHFRMIRYAGFLANRVRGELLPIVKKLTGSNDELFVSHISWRTLYRKTFGANPLQCILCQSVLRLAFLRYGLSSLEFESHHTSLCHHSCHFP